MAGQGNYMSEDEIKRVIYLLASTEMTMAEIAQRMSCHKSVVTAINRRHQVRAYNGLRSNWRVVKSV
jgi:hypothetical protein